MKKEIYNKIREQAEKIIDRSGLKVDDKVRENIDSLLYELSVHQVELEIQNEELIHTQIELEKIKSNYYNLFEHAPIEYVVIDKKFDIVEANILACNLLKKPKDELIGKPFLVYIHEDYRNMFINTADNAFKNDKPFYIEMKIINSNLKEIPVYTSLISYKQDENTNYLFVSLANLSKLKETEHKLEKLNAELEERIKIRTKELEEEIKERKRIEEVLKETNTIKDKIYSIIAHDLIGPFNAILGMSEVLKREYNSMSDEERLNFIFNIDKAGRNLFNLLQNLLNWANLQKDKIKVLPERFNIYNLVQNVIEIFKDNALNKRIAIENLLDKELYVYADKNMISIVVHNLISNAIKFCHLGGIIRLNYEDNLNECKILIEDNGIGIKEEKLGKLFDEDNFSTELGTLMEKGTGLGLKICKEFIAKNGGSLGVISTFGKGSTFWFALPKGV